MSKNLKDFISGLAVGIIAPPITFYFFCLFAFPETSVVDQLMTYIRRHVLTHVISLAAIINLALFFIFLQMNKDFISRGILGATFIYAAFVLILKII